MSSQVIDGWKPIRGVPGKTIVTQNSDGSYTVTIDPSAIGDGSGDMLKATYDIDGNGIVDAAESVPWAGITDVPSTFTPSSHDHDDRYYTETEIGTILTGYSVTTHDHDLDYSALSHDHDDRYYTESEIGTILGGYVAKSLYDANSMLYATDDDTPTALTVGASTIVGRGAAGGIAALSASDARTVLGLGTMALEAATSYIANSLLTTRGDIIVRNATVPERLALTVPSSPVINFLGVANGETQPSWKSASSNPGAAAAVLATDASGYTSVIRLGIGAAASDLLSVTLAASGNTLNQGVTITRTTGTGTGFIRFGNATSNTNNFIPAFNAQANVKDASFQIYGFQPTSDSTAAAIVFAAGNATRDGAIDGTDIAIALYNYATPLVNLLGNGNFGINKTAPNSKLAVVGLVDYANNAAAVSAGLSAGDFYTETGTNPKRVCVVY